MPRKHGTVVLTCCILGLILSSHSKGEEPKAPEKSVDTRVVAKANNEFAINLYRELAKDAKPGENVFFSPYSISSALAMTYAGARGETAREMSQVLRFAPDQEQFHPAFASLAHQIRNPGNSFKGEFTIANAIWVASSVKILAPFRNCMNLHYGANLRTIAFLDSKSARKAINGWVAEQTKNKIGELLPLGAITADTQMVLANAMYFQANWLIPFKRTETKVGMFFRTPEDPISVPMMHLKERLRYAKTEDVQIVELPYAGEQFSMVLLLPTSHDKFGEVEKNLDRLGEWMKKVRPHGGGPDDAQTPGGGKIPISQDTSKNGTASSVWLPSGFFRDISRAVWDP